MTSTFSLPLHSRQHKPEDLLFEIQLPDPLDKALILDLVIAVRHSRHEFCLLKPGQAIARRARGHPLTESKLFTEAGTYGDRMQILLALSHRPKDRPVGGVQSPPDRPKTRIAENVRYRILKRRLRTLISVLEIAPEEAAKEFRRPLQGIESAQGIALGEPEPAERIHLSCHRRDKLGPQPFEWLDRRPVVEGFRRSAEHLTDAILCHAVWQLPKQVAIKGKTSVP